MTPTQRSLTHMRNQGYRCAVVEKWNAHIRRRQDLFGVIDLLAIGNGGTIAVQTTSGSNVAARVRKIAECEALADMRDAGWRVIVHGWRKGKNGRYTLREVDVS